MAVTPFRTMTVAGCLGAGEPLGLHAAFRRVNDRLHGNRPRGTRHIDFRSGIRIFAPTQNASTMPAQAAIGISQDFQENRLRFANDGLRCLLADGLQHPAVEKFRKRWLLGCRNRGGDRRPPAADFLAGGDLFRLAARPTPRRRRVRSPVNSSSSHRASVASSGFVFIF